MPMNRDNVKEFYKLKQSKVLEKFKKFHKNSNLLKLEKFYEISIDTLRDCKIFNLL